MKKLFLFTATAALILAAPSAFAAPQDKGGQHGDHGGQGHGGGEHASPAKAEHAPAAARAERGNRSHGMATTTASPALGATPSHGRNQLHMSDVARANAAANANRPANNRNTKNRNDNNNHNANNNRNDNRGNNNRGNDNSNYGNDNHANRGNGHGNNHSDFNRRDVRAQHHYHYRGGAYRGPSGYSYRRWTFGESLPSIYFTQNYWISDYSDYGLQYPPEGTVWVRYGDDALLIDRYSGEILEVVYGQFY